MMTTVEEGDLSNKKRPCSNEQVKMKRGNDEWIHKEILSKTQAFIIYNVLKREKIEGDSYFFYSGSTNYSL